MGRLPRLIVLWAAALLAQDPAAPQKSYVLGGGDVVTLLASETDELGGKMFRISQDGTVALPLVGRLKAGGLTIEQFEAEVAARLRQYVKEPVVIVNVTEYRSQPVSVLGAVTNPGVHQLQGSKRLFEVLSLAGGLRNEAGNTIKITRRKQWGLLPLPGAKEDPSGEFSVGEVSVKSIMEARNPQENILVQPNDVISVPKAELVYVVGSVRRSGGFVLSERESISVLQALSLAEGLDRMAKARDAKILRASLGGANRDEIPVDLQKILAGKSRDVPLVANDILFVPSSAAKSATMRGLEAIVQLGTGMAIYRR